MQTAHPTLVFFRGAIHEPGELVGYLEASRDKPFGRLTVDTLSIVRYRRTDVCHVRVACLHRPVVIGEGELDLTLGLNRVLPGAASVPGLSKQWVGSPR